MRAKMKSINAKISISIFIVLVITMSVLALGLYQTQSASDKQQMEETDKSLTELMVRFINFAMNEGIYNIDPLKKDLLEVENIINFKGKPISRK